MSSIRLISVAETGAGLGSPVGKQMGRNPGSHARHGTSLVRVFLILRTVAG